MKIGRFQQSTSVNASSRIQILVKKKQQNNSNETKNDFKFTLLTYEKQTLGTCT